MLFYCFYYFPQLLLFCHQDFISCLTEVKAAFATTEVAKPYLYARERRALLYEVYVTITGSKAIILSDLGQNSRPHKAIEIHDKATLKTISHQSESLHVYTTY